LWIPGELLRVHWLMLRCAIPDGLQTRNLISPPLKSSLDKRSRTRFNFYA
jgi:hypothetical protein